MIALLEKQKNKWNDITWRVITPEGDAYITINEHEPGKIAFIQVIIGKAGSSVNAYAAALANSVSANLNFLSIRQTQTLLSGYSSDRGNRNPFLPNSVKSIPEAIVWTLDRYLDEYRKPIKIRRLRRPRARR